VSSKKKNLLVHHNLLIYENNVFSAQHSSADFTTFLDDFVFNVFLPQIGDKIFELFRQSTNGKLTIF
jgi:hypothetical protein